MPPESTLTLHCGEISLLLMPDSIRCIHFKIDERYPPWDPTGSEFELQLSVADDDDDGTCLVLGDQSGTSYGWSGRVRVGMNRVLIDFDRPFDSEVGSVGSVDIFLAAGMMHASMRDAIASVCKAPVRFAVLESPLDIAVEG